MVAEPIPAGAQRSLDVVLVTGKYLRSTCDLSQNTVYLRANPSRNAYTLSIDDTPTTVRGLSIGTIVHALQVPRAIGGWYGACRCWDSIVLHLRNDCRRCTSCDCGKASETANDPRMAIAETNADISVLSLSGLCAHGHSRGSARGNVIVGICLCISGEASQCPAATFPCRPAGAAV